MRQLDIIAPALAKAIRACNGQRITQEAAKAAASEIAQLSDPTQIAENLGPLLNLSALNQELERSGLVHTERTLSALMTAVKAELARPITPLAGS